MGRLLIANDQVKSPTAGLVSYVNLNDLGGSVKKSVFEPYPSSNIRIAGNDHELVTFSNGDVLYVRVSWITSTLKSKPAWFDVSYDFDKDKVNEPDDSVLGPGTRKGLIVWRSTDGGETFKYVSSFDPALAEDGSGALPKHPFRTLDPGTVQKPVWRNGGVDGPLVKVDIANDTVYVTHWCIGQLQDTSVATHYVASDKYLNKSLILVSKDKGSTWKSLGFLGVKQWRGHIVPLEDGKLGFGSENALFFGRPLRTGKYEFDTAGLVTPSGEHDAINLKSEFGSKTGLDKYMKVNSTQKTIVFPTGTGSNMAIAYPSNLASRGKGYRLYFFDRATQKFGEGPPIKTVVAGDNNFIMHLTPIDLGSGPVLLYWYDVNAKSFAVSIRGRLIAGDGESTADFTISRLKGKLDAYNVKDAGKYWYGDYHAAGGYIEEVTPKGAPGSSALLRLRRGYVEELKPKGAAAQVQLVHHYFPVWTRPDGTTRVAHVSYVVSPTTSTAVKEPILVSKIPWNKWIGNKKRVSASELNLRDKVHEVEDRDGR